MIINPTGVKNWTNRHQTFTQKVDNLYDLVNANTGDVLADYNATTQGVQGIIKEAIDTNKRLRVLGGEWSWSKIAATDGILLNTKLLNLSFTVGPESVAVGRNPQDYHFAQCGVSVKELSDRLRPLRRSLKTTGASNGQTIAGALSTGTHGAAIDIGSIPDYVVGLHIIVSDDLHVWLERASYSVASAAFVQRIGATLIEDDDLFNAALVSFGSFGFIHGVMVETVPLFLYECFRIKLPIGDDLYDLMGNLDFANTRVPLPQGKERPYHFQTLINQYDRDKEAYVTVMYKREFKEQYPHTPITAGVAPGDDVPSFIGSLTQALPSVVPGIVNLLMKNSYAPYKDVWGTHSEIFTNTDTHGKVLSLAIGVPLNQVRRVSELLIDLNTKKGPFVGVFAFRFVKGTTATLGFTRFEDTCVIELDSVFSKQSYDFYDHVYSTLFSTGIQFTFHWGKLFKMNATQVRAMYGPDNVDRWIAARRKIMGKSAAMWVFTNELMQQLGLDGGEPAFA